MSEQISGESVYNKNTLSIEVDSERLARIEAIMWTYAEDVAILDANTSGPFKNIRISVEGSDTLDGEFGVNADMDLGPAPKKGKELYDISPKKIARFFEEHLEDWPHIKIPAKHPFYYVRGFGNSTFLMGTTDKSYRKLFIRTCDNLEDETAPVNADSFYMLQHGKHATATEFNYFRAMLSRFLTDFYDEFGWPEETELETDVPDAVDRDDDDDNDTNTHSIEYRYPTLNDIGGLESVKKTLRDYINELRYPEIMAEYGVRPRSGVLLSGPGGTGKTMLANAFANEIGAEIITINPGQIYDKWQGNAEKALQKVFDDAKEADGPVVLYFNEFDGIIQQRKGLTTENRLAALFKKLAEGLDGSSKVILWADTNNNLDDLDPNLVRSGRFDIKIAIPEPDEKSLSGIIGSLIMRNFEMSPKTNFDIEDIHFDQLGKAAHDREMSGSDVARVLDDLILTRVQHRVTQMELPEEERTEPLVIDHNMLLRAIRGYYRS